MISKHFTNLINIVWLLLLVASLLLISIPALVICSEAAQKGIIMNNTIDREVLVRAEKIIHDYIALNKEWDKSKYTIEPQSHDPDKREITFVVHNNDDKNVLNPDGSLTRGGEESFLIIFDVPSMAVKRELSFQ